MGREGNHRTEDFDDGNERRLGGSRYHSDYDLGNEPESDSTPEADGRTGMEAELQFYNDIWSGLTFDEIIKSLPAVAHLVITNILRVVGPRPMRAQSPAHHEVVFIPQLTRG
jgi:hypothetical protein